MQFRKYLHGSNNKLELIEFLIDDLSNYINTLDILKDREFSVTVHTISFAEILFHLKRWHKISVETKKKLTTKCFYLHPLLCILFLNLFVLSDTGFGSNYSQKHAGKLYNDMLTDPNRLFNFSKIKLTKQFSQAMAGFHAVTGSDFTCSFHELGKMKGLNLLRKNYMFSGAFILLDEEANLNERTIQVIERLICEFYEKQNTTELNDVRYQMFRVKTASGYYQLKIILCFILSVQTMWHLSGNKSLAVVLRR